MILSPKFNAVFISTKSTSSIDKDGRQVFNDYIAIESNDEVGNVLCTAQVKKELSDLPKYSEVEFECRFDTWKKELVVRSFKRL